MRQPAIFFDLDGTLTDSGEGVIKCAQVALRHFGLPAEDWETLRAFVGPPLRVSFPRFGVPADQVEHALEIYRERYHRVGKFENAPYPGIRALLDRLREAGFRLYVATSKPEPTSLEILDKFELTGCFDLVCGATFDGSRDSKEEVLRYLMDQLPAGQEALLVGDTIYDVEGANRVGIPTVGVTWGYGDPGEMTAAGAVDLVDTPEALCDWILKRYPISEA